jgi:hypothetical protein
VRPHQTALLLAGVVSLLGFFFTPVQMVLLPLGLLNTHLHELAHALAALLTGGTPEYIRVNADTSGVTPIAGGFLPIVASAGYLGAAAVGAGIVYAMRSENGARWALRLTSLALAFSMVLFVRGDLVGILSGVFWTGALFAASKYLNGHWLSFTAALVGLQQGLNALRSLFELLQITTRTEIHSDATLMQQSTLIPAPVWSIIWGLCGLAVIGFTVRRTWAPNLPKK